MTKCDMCDNACDKCDNVCDISSVQNVNKTPSRGETKVDLFL